MTFSLVASCLSLFSPPLSGTHQCLSNLVDLYKSSLTHPGSPIRSLSHLSPSPPPNPVSPLYSQTPPAMIRALSLTLFALCSLTVLADDDVVVATKDNFDEIIGSDELTLVKFYAPWCGHCKKMAGDFKEAATELKGKAVLVDLDATEEKDLAAKYEVRGFPTLKLFSGGELITDYKGGRTKDALIKFINNALLPSSVDCEDADAVTAFIKENTGKCILFGAGLDKLASDFKKVSMSLRDVMPDNVAFGSVSDPALVDKLSDKDVTADSILVIRDDDSTDVYSDEASGLEAWAKVAALPLFAELSRETATLYTELDRPIFMLFQDPDNKDEAVNTAISEIAKSYRSDGSVVFTWINAVELKSFAEHIGVEEMKPAIAIYEFKRDVKYVFSDEYSPEALKEWVQKFLDGKIDASTKSEPIPEKNDEPVKVVVGDSWASIVEDESKDVLIEQYAPWCGHCKKLAPILDELASDLGGVETLVIAKMDATKNDAPADYKAQGFPTIHFFKAGSKTGTAYQGGRSKEDFVKFLKENCTHKEGIELKEESGEESDKEEL
eukprot:GFKZ01005395.1.p1 GENE.GFKZ01005395.1~~GFKZ01005395.1.p1  ORF type:complete len:553 (-),score=110.77 GFKZ01005395.1:908-2566(-)